jgi:type III pantothenate kinase
MKRSDHPLLLLDIGNTHTHLGVADHGRIIRQYDFPTGDWQTGGAARYVLNCLRKKIPAGVAFCSVVPKATPKVVALARRRWGLEALALTPRTLCEIGLDYPHPETVGPDRLANAIAVAHHYGVPAIVIDFGTAVTFDVVDRQRNYVGGIIAPGLSALTDYLHEKTALLPRIQIREIDSVVGKSTEEAMRIGAVHGYRGLIRELLKELRRELGCRHLTVVATGGYAALMAAKLPEITAVDSALTLEGVRLCWWAQPQKKSGSACNSKQGQGRSGTVTRRRS